MDGVERIVFRASVQLRVSTTLGCLGLAAFAIIGAKSSAALTVPQKVATGVIFGSFAAALAYLAAIRPRLEVSSTVLRVVGPVGHREVPTADVVRVDGGTRLVITLRSGERVPVWAVQNSRITELRGVWGPADEVAARVSDFLELKRHST